MIMPFDSDDENSRDGSEFLASKEEVREIVIMEIQAVLERIKAGKRCTDDHEDDDDDEDESPPPRKKTKNSIKT